MWPSRKLCCGPSNKRPCTYKKSCEHAGNDILICKRFIPDPLFNSTKRLMPFTRFIASHSCDKSKKSSILANLTSPLEYQSRTTPPRNTPRDVYSQVVFSANREQGRETSLALTSTWHISSTAVASLPALSKQSHPLRAPDSSPSPLLVR